MSRLFQICLIALVALTLGHAQVFGVHRASVCSDFAQPQETKADHCHTAVQAAAIACEKPEVEADCPPGKVSKHSEGNVPADFAKTAASGSASISNLVVPAFVPLATLADITAFERLLDLLAGYPASDPPSSFHKDSPKYGVTSVEIAESIILLV